MAVKYYDRSQNGCAWQLMKCKSKQHLRDWAYVAAGCWRHFPPADACQWHPTSADTCWSFRAPEIPCKPLRTPAIPSRRPSMLREPSKICQTLVTPESCQALSTAADSLHTSDYPCHPLPMPPKTRQCSFPTFIDLCHPLWTPPDKFWGMVKSEVEEVLLFIYLSKLILHFLFYIFIFWGRLLNVNYTPWWAKHIGFWWWLHHLPWQQQPFLCVLLKKKNRRNKKVVGVMCSAMKLFRHKIFASWLETPKWDHVR